MPALRTVALSILGICLAAHPAGAGQPGKSPVKVFILAGQSNMEGAGAIKANPSRNAGQGTLEYLVKSATNAVRFKHLVNADGTWRERPDVWIRYLGRKGNLSAGYGARGDTIGPELQFGHAIGDALENQVLLIKTAWGGKSLQKDFRPPSSGGETGAFYRQMLEHVRQTLANLKTLFPEYDGQGHEIAGFGWHQGWNDGLTHGAVNEYEENLANLVKDLRRDLGVPQLPVVIANSGFGGWNQKIDRRLNLVKAQLAVAKRPEFKGTVITVETRDFFRPPEVSPSKQGYHWNGNAETYFLIGEAMGEAMKKLLGVKPAQ